MLTREEKLDAYVRSVIGDMMARGVIKYQEGWTISQILQQDGPKVAAEIATEFNNVLASVGADLINMLEGAAHKQIERVTDGVGGFIRGELDRLLWPKTKKRR